MTEIHCPGAGVVVAGCSRYGRYRSSHGIGRVSRGVHHHVDGRELRLRRACAADANSALAVHCHGRKDEITILGGHQPFLHQTTVADSYLVPENPRTRTGFAYCPIAAEHAALADKSAIDPPSAAASPQFGPWLWLESLHLRRGIVGRQVLSVQLNRLQV